MSDYYKNKYEALKKELRFQCPKCQASNQYRIIEFPSFRYSRFGEYTVQCLSCGHKYGVEDDCTG